MEKIAIVSTVGAPIGHLTRNVSYHLKLGIDVIILFCDDPLDDAVQIYASHPQVTAVPCTDEYWRQHGGNRPVSLEDRQIANVNEGARMAHEQGCAWMTHIDCDELIYPSRAIKQVLASSKADVIRYNLLEAVPEVEEYAHPFMPTLFRKRPNQWQILASKALGCSSAYYCEEYFRGHKSSKVVVRLTSKIIKHGIHRPDAYEEGTIFRESNELKLLHYYSISYSCWKYKYEALGLAIRKGANLEDLSPSRKKQFQDYAQAREKGETELVALYTRTYMISYPIRGILFWLGMLSLVELEPWLCHALINRKLRNPLASDSRIMMNLLNNVTTGPIAPRLTNLFILDFEDF